VSIPDKSASDLRKVRTAVSEQWAHQRISAMTSQPSTVNLHPRMAVSVSTLGALLERRRAGHSLEAPFYLSEEIFQADMEYIFRRHWIFVGVSPQVAEPGDYFCVPSTTSAATADRACARSTRAASATSSAPTTSGRTTSTAG
jgi:hypothetical protein